VSEQVLSLFEALDLDDSGTVSSSFLIEFLGRNGLNSSNPRLNEFFAFLNKGDINRQLSLDEFNTCIAQCSSLVHKCITGGLRVPEFNQLIDIIKDTYAKVLPNKSGQVATYIPQLGRVNPEQFAISLTTTDGQHFSIGDSDERFCIQSCSKPISYLLALDKFTGNYVHKYVGTEPSGRPFNEIVLKDAPSPENPGRQIPHNPCINAGAIVVASMVEPDVMDQNQRFEQVLDSWRRLSAAERFETEPIGYCEETYKSESLCANRNWCLAYMMMEKDSYPPCCKRHDLDRLNLNDTLELYFKMCSILSTNRAMSVMAATLANGGLNPWSEKIVCSATNVRYVLPMMLASGMYDYSGQWAYEVGVPAKSGVGGCVFMVVPNVCGISVWSPRLNAEGNSVRAVAVASELVKSVQLHGFEVFNGLDSKMDPKKNRTEEKENQLSEVLFAASIGDVRTLMKLQHIGVHLFEGDYDSRTAMHLAATEGHAQSLQFLVDCMPDDEKSELLNKEDRWKGTPLDDAKQYGHVSCVKILEYAGATVQGKRQVHAPEHLRKATPSEDGPEAISAGSRGDLDQLVKLRARGVDVSFDHHDYDLRTPLHLAASNGHLSCVKYLIYQAQKLLRTSDMAKATDRWGNTALDDAIREGHTAVQEFLLKYTLD
jgi:glutaminase